MTLKKQSIRSNMHITANGEPISKEELTAGTFLGEYPSRVQYVIQDLRGRNARQR